MEEITKLLTMKKQKYDGEESTTARPRTVEEVVEQGIRDRREGKTKPQAGNGSPEPEPISSGALAALSTQPMPPNIVVFNVGSQKIRLGTGLYLVTGGAGAGKSVASLGLAHCARTQGQMEVGHLYFFEHNAPSYKKRGDVRMFSDPKKFIDLGQESGDLIEYFGAWVKARTNKDKPALIVLDSIGIPMRSFASEDRRGQTAAEQGMQPADRLFVEQLDLLATTRSLILIGVVNSELVPFAAKLYGAVQGLINAQTARSFTKNDRAGGRTGDTYELPVVALKSALATMRYEQRKEQ